jgi:hypothetical protein
MNRFAILCTVWLGLVGAGCEEGTTESNNGPCATHDDCSGTQFCIDGVCQEPSCTSDSECPAGYQCLASGACKKDVECETDTDCPPGKSCVDYRCAGTTCSPDGQTLPCFIGCHEGQKSCLNGDWSGCDAPPVLEGEACGNQIDDDCDGQVDEDCIQCGPADAPLPCSTHRLHLRGSWGRRRSSLWQVRCHGPHVQTGGKHNALYVGRVRPLSGGGHL